MELCLVIPIIGLFIIALSIVFFLLAFISTKCYNKLKNIKVFYLYCLFLLIIGFLILLISVNPENEENLLEKLKNIIYDIDDKYSPCKEKKDQDENNKDHKEFDKENQNIYNKIKENETNINDDNKIYDNNLNDDNKTYDNNLNDNKKDNDNNSNDDNNLNDDNKMYDYDFNDESINKGKNKEDENKNNENKNEYIIEHSNTKNNITGYIRNVSFNPQFFVYNFAKFWIKFANFLRVVGRKIINFIYKDRNIKE